jgi:protein N-terminal amidase
MEDKKKPIHPVKVLSL